MEGKVGVGEAEALMYGEDVWLGKVVGVCVVGRVIFVIFVKYMSFDAGKRFSISQKLFLGWD